MPDGLTFAETAGAVRDREKMAISWLESSQPVPSQKQLREAFDYPLSSLFVSKMVNSKNPVTRTLKGNEKQLELAGPDFEWSG